MTRSAKPKTPTDVDAATPAPARYFRNICPTGARWLPLADAIVPRRGLVEVPAHQAHLIADQDVWDEVPAEVAIAELAALEGDHGDEGDQDADLNAGIDDQAAADAAAQNQGE